MKLKEIFKLLKEEHNLLNLFWVNFGKVDDGVYRSAQLLPWRLKKILKKHNIKTVINLRGNNKNYMYKLEKDICSNLGVEYHTISLLSRSPERIRKEELQKLIDIFNNSPKPVLFHCKAGADRTGFAAVLWHIINGGDKHQAIKKELNIKYLYLPFTKAGKIKKVFEMYDEGDFVEWFDNNRENFKNIKTSKLADLLYDKILKRE
ncbi:MAG: dual specificity protein phosphatase family protein [Epsilonproteobacteria bacterium]|nr:dual specificity protein phosphatase family protein [Campylobacterota bacterium]